MFKSILIAVAVLIASSTPAGAQQSSVWSATMTVGGTEFPDGRKVVGYSPIFGEISDSDFDFRGTTYSIDYLFQHLAGRRLGSVIVEFSPAMDDADLESLMVTADGQQLTVLFNAQVGSEDNPRASAIGSEDPGFRWTAGQSIAVGLTTSQRVPALPLVGAGLLAMLLLGIGAYRRRRA